MKSVKPMTEEIFLTQLQRSDHDDAFSPFPLSASHVCCVWDIHGVSQQWESVSPVTLWLLKTTTVCLEKPLIHWAAGQYRTAPNFWKSHNCCVILQHILGMHVVIGDYLQLWLQQRGKQTRWHMPHCLSCPWGCWWKEDAMLPQQ